MIARRKTRSGQTFLQIKLTFRNRDTNEQERYRRDAQVQTMAGARAEEQRIVAHYTKCGTIRDLLAPAIVPKADAKPEVHTWTDAVKLYRETYAPRLKPSTRAGYAGSRRS